MSDIFISTDVQGTEAFRCASRTVLRTKPEQLRLDEWRKHAHRASPGGRPPMYFFGHCADSSTGKQLRVSLAEREWLYFPRAWKSERQLHDTDCGTVGNGTHSSGSSGYTGVYDFEALFHRAFDSVYASYSDTGISTPSSFCADLQHLLQVGGPKQSSLAAEFVFRVGLASNPERTAYSNPDGSDNVSVTVFDREGRQNDAVWSIASSVPLNVRTTPSGDTFPLPHIIAGAWLRDSSLAHLQAWPVFIGNGVHSVHSIYEHQFLSLLDKAGAGYIKPPSSSYLKNHATEGLSELFAQLAERNVWPDVVLRINGIACVVEVAAFASPGYLVALVAKTMKFLRLERDLGLQWAILKPVGERLLINRSSSRLELRQLLPELVSPGYSSQHPAA